MSRLIQGLESESGLCTFSVSLSTKLRTRTKRLLGVWRQMLSNKPAASGIKGGHLGPCESQWGSLSDFKCPAERERAAFNSAKYGRFREHNFYSFGKHVRFDIYCSACLYSCPISVKDDMIRQHFVADQSCTFSSARARMQKRTLIGKISSNVNLSQDKALPPKRDHMVAAFVAIPMRSRRRNDSEFY